MEIISKNETETFVLSKQLAQKFQPGDIIALEGDLGSGKTTFVRGLAKAYGIKNNITSPTFTILKEYPLINNPRKIKKLIHIDAYRITSRDDAENIGIFELLNSKENLKMIEWPENLSFILQEYKIKHIKFLYIDENTRKITIE